MKIQNYRLGSTPTQWNAIDSHTFACWEFDIFMLPYYNFESYRPYRRNMILKPFWYTSYVYLDICLELRLTDCILLRLLLWHPPYFSLRITFLVTNSFKLSTAIAFSLTLSFRCFYLLWQYMRIPIVEPVSRNIQIYQYSNFEQLMVMETLFKFCMMCLVSQLESTRMVLCTICYVNTHRLNLSIIS